MSLIHFQINVMREEGNFWKGNRSLFQASSRRISLGSSEVIGNTIVIGATSLGAVCRARGQAELVAVESVGAGGVVQRAAEAVVTCGARRVSNLR